MHNRKLSPIRLLALLLLIVFASASVGCESTTYVGVSYGYPGWGGPCCYGGGGWHGGYMGGPVW